MLLLSVALFHTARAADIGSAAFDKDDDLAVEFVTAAANLRSQCYNIPTQVQVYIYGMGWLGMAWHGGQAGGKTWAVAGGDEAAAALVPLCPCASRGRAALGRRPSACCPPLPPPSRDVGQQACTCHAVSIALPLCGVSLAYRAWLAPIAACPFMLLASAPATSSLAPCTASHAVLVLLQSLFDAKGMAGNIIHAIATTNAIISGLIVAEALKLLAGEACMRRRSGRQARGASSRRCRSLPPPCHRGPRTISVHYHNKGRALAGGA